MMKLLAIGVWVCLVSLGASWAAAAFLGPTPEVAEGEAAEASFFAGLDYRNTDLITVPLMASGGRKGYLLADFVYTIDGRIAESLSVPPDPVIRDTAFRQIYTADQLDLDNPESYDIDGLTTRIREAVNERYGTELVHDVFIEQFDFLTNAMIRQGQ